MPTGYQIVEQSKIHASDCRITNPAVFRAAMQLPLNRIAYSAQRGGKLAGDDAGHIFADRFGGSPELDNLVSQTTNVNRSKFATLEIQWAKALGNGQQVEVKIKINYEGDALRPSSFDVEYKIDGVLNPPLTINN